MIGEPDLPGRRDAGSLVSGGALPLTMGKAMSRASSVWIAIVLAFGDPVVW